MSIDKDNYTRVTTILYPFSGLQNVDSTIIAKAASRGTRVHTICEGIVKGIPPILVDEETSPYVESFKKWYTESLPVKEIEKRFWDEDLKITGQVDFILEEDNKHTIIDIKTSARPSPTWSVQGNAYAYLAEKNGYNIKSIQFIKLSKKGHKPTIYNYDKDPEMFFSCYKVYSMFFKGK